jgi:hypothetical protein
MADTRRQGIGRDEDPGGAEVAKVPAMAVLFVAIQPSTENEALKKGSTMARRTSLPTSSTR